MLGILLCKTRAREFSKFARNKLLARTGCDTGITTTESTGAVGQSVIARAPDVTSLDHAPPTRTPRPHEGIGIGYIYIYIYILQYLAISALTVVERS